MQTKSKAKTSLSERVFRILREAIASNSFSDTPLFSESVLHQHVEEKLKLLDSAEFSEKSIQKASKTPVRRAIAQFEMAGILETIPQKGTCVRRLDDDELFEVWEDRVATEELVLTRLAKKRERDLGEAKSVHEEMKLLVKGELFERISDEIHTIFVSKDEQFHAELAIAAGLPGIAEELSLLRLKLQLASPVRKFRTRHRYLAIIEEHEAILKALGANSSDLNELQPRPDLNAVKLAFLVHMKNSGRDSWMIEGRVSRERVFGQNDVFDIPNIAATSEDNLPVEHLLQMRLSTEFCAVSLLAAQPNPDLRVLDSLHSEMIAIASSGSVDGSLSLQLQSRFLNLDLSFHSALTFLAGMLFGEEVVGYTWHKIWDLTSHGLDVGRCKKILQEHERIIDSIKSSQGTQKGVRLATKAAEAHVIKSFVRNEFSQEMIRKCQIWLTSQKRLLSDVQEELDAATTLGHVSSLNSLNPMPD